MKTSDFETYPGSDVPSHLIPLHDRARVTRRRMIGQLAKIKGPNRTVRKGENAYSMGDRDSSLYLVVSGYVKSTIVTRNGKSCLLDIHPQGDIVGEGVLIGDRRMETATAMTDLTLRAISRDQMMKALSRDEMQEAYVLYLTSLLQERQHAITALVAFDCEQRLAFMLQQVAAKLGRRTGDLVVVDQRLTQEELADMVGTTRSRIGTFLKHFRQAGILVPARGSTLVLREPALRRYVAAYL